MQPPEGYTLHKALRAGGASLVYLATGPDGSEVVLKTYSPRSDPQPALHLRQEFQALRSAAGPGVPTAIHLIDGPEVPVLVIERVAGVSLSAWVAESRPSIAAFLEVAVQAAEVLARVHAVRLIHCDLSPHNLIVEPGTLRTHVIDFGHARPLSAGALRRTASTGGELTGPLQFIAPEQTGRMNRGIDTRSDLYSLGATLYFVLTQQTLFTTTDPLAILHAHMARVPRAASEVRSDVPVALSRMLLKLVEKEPDNRYQTASALLADLRTCREQLARQGRIDAALELGTAEAPDRPRFPRKVYGRDPEIALLRDAYARAAEGSVRVLMIEGDPGAGKSALVDELRPQIAETGGHLAVGKFDVSRDRPYAAWISALDMFVQQLLVESDARLSRWTEILGGALGNVARVLIDLVPDLQFVLGDAPPVPKLGPRETQARLALALSRLIAACATRDHPLVLFLDDLQWSDPASLALVQDVLGESHGASLLLLGAFRSSEVSLDHPIERLFVRLGERGISVQSMILHPLGVDATVAMLAAALQRTPTEVRELAALSERTTGNLPLLVRQWLDHVHGRGLLEYSRGQGWRWDSAAIAAADIPEGAVALIADKLQRLGSEARTAIELASCVGDEFDLDLLAELSQRERASLERGLYALCDAGFIAPCSRGFRFLHDRLREAARMLLSEQERAKLHFDIAQLLLTRLTENERRERVFEIAEHLNRGIVHLPRTQRSLALDLDLQAGKRALAAGAASTAEVYLAAARELLREEDWTRPQSPAFDLMMHSADSAFLRRDFDLALGLLDQADAHPLAPLQAAQSAARRIQVYALTRTPEECTRHALQVLRQFGVRWPLRPSRLRAVVALRIVRWQLRWRGVDVALRPAPTLHPRWLAPTIVLGASAAAISRFDFHLTVLIACRVVASNIRRGYVARPVYSLVGWCSLLRMCLDDAQTSHTLAGAARERMDQHPDPIYGPRTDLQTWAIDEPWFMRRRRALAPLEQCSERALEVGDLEYSYYARFLKVAYSALAGEPVSSADRTLRELAESVQRAGHLYPEPALFARPYGLLVVRDPNALAFESEIAASEAELASSGGSAEPYVRTAWVMVLCIHGRWELALAQSERLGDRLFTFMPFIHIADHTFFRALAAAVLCTSPSGEPRRHARMLRDALRRIDRWARHGPDFAPMLCMLQAERARLRGDLRRSRALHEEAAQRAEKQEFLHLIALAHERRARLFALERRESEAAAAIEQAIMRYRAWGCEAKACALEQELRDLQPR